MVHSPSFVGDSRAYHSRLTAGQKTDNDETRLYANLQPYLGRGELMGHGELIGTGDRIGRGSFIGAGGVIGRGPLNGASAGTGRFGLKKGMPKCSSIVHGGGSGRAARCGITVYLTHSDEDLFSWDKATISSWPHERVQQNPLASARGAFRFRSELFGQFADSLRPSAGRKA
jgi:hypothetical protein